MKRGEIWTVAGGAAYIGKPRPAVIIQDDSFDANDSIVVCPLTTDPTPAPTFRLLVQPTDGNGLLAPCRLMIDKLAAVPRTRLRQRVGALERHELFDLSRAIVVFLGLAGATGR
jgi:mRNA interferase MazF